MNDKIRSMRIGCWQEFSSWDLKVHEAGDCRFWNVYSAVTSFRIAIRINYKEKDLSLAKLAAEAKRRSKLNDIN